MKKISDSLNNFINQSNNNEGDLLISKRTKQVHKIWASCVEDTILEHTNSVYIIKENQRKKLFVYVDDSLYAAELNARRELIKLKMLTDYNEKIDDFKICISRGSYKKNHPFKKKSNYYSEKIPDIELSEEEIKKVEELVLPIKDKKLRTSLKKAILAEKKWQKNNNKEKNNKD